MISVTLYAGFKKKTNSTKQPDASVMQMTVNGILKEPSDILNPTISFQKNPEDYGFQLEWCQFVYAWIPIFDRYYFVNNWTWNDGLWVVSLSVDVLATYKGAIGNLNEYVLRADTLSDYDGDISDCLYPATTNFDIVETTASNPFVSSVSSGCYVVGIINGATLNNIGAITYYAMNPTQFSLFKENLLTDKNLTTMEILDNQQPPQPLITDMSVPLIKAMYNPFQYVASCTWYPFSISHLPIEENPRQMAIGWWTYTSVFGYYLTGNTCSFSETGSFSTHPDASARGNYLNYAPYSRRTIIGRFGAVPIDSSFYKVGNNIKLEYLVDVITGQCRVYIKAEELNGSSVVRSVVITERDFLLGVPIQLAQIGVDYMGTAVSAFNTVGSAIGGAIAGGASAGGVGAIGGFIGGVANGIYNTIQSAMPQMETSGSNGSFITCSVDTKILNHFYRIAEEDIHHKGRPVCSIMTIHALTGFIQCADPDVDIACYEQERKAIGNHLISGFFYE